MQKEIKDRINKRKIAYVYLLHRMFGGSPLAMLKIMKIPNVTEGDLEDWDRDYRDAVYATIAEEDARGVEMKDPHEDVPSIKSIKEKILRQTEKVIAETTDPSRLASAYKVLSEFEVADDKKEKSVLDAINEAVKPLTPKKKEKLTMLEKMKQQGRLPEVPKGAVEEDEEEMETEE